VPSNIYCLLFEDDTLIFCNTNSNIHNLCCLFLCFEAVSGLRINLAKSELVPPIGNVNNVGGLASILGCRVFSLPMKYLGFPMAASFKANLFGMMLLRR